MCNSVAKLQMIETIDSYYGLEETSHILDKIIYSYTMASLESEDLPPGKELSEHIHLLNLLKETFGSQKE